MKFRNLIRTLILFSVFSLGFFVLRSQTIINTKSEYNSKAVSEFEKEYTTGLFKSDDAYTLITLDDPVASSWLTVFDYLQGRVPGLIIWRSYTFTPIVRYRFGKPAFFLDEMPVSADLLAMVNMNDVAMIKVFRPPFLGAIGGGGNGAIAVYTKRGGDE